jgi:drug/metabolite transporter (DMT)-like permease
MMPELLALSSAVVFGLVHFLSGLLARRAGSYAVAVLGQLGGLVLVGGSAVLVPSSGLVVSDLAWGALSGLGTGIGVAFLYRGLSIGNMSVVVPLSDVGALVLPVVIGVLLLGDRPTLLAWVGVAAAIPALWLVSRTGAATDPAAATGTLDGLVAGAGFALQFVAISRVDLDAGLWPVFAARVLAVVTITALAVHRRASLRAPRALILPAGVVGAAGSGAIVLYLLATQQQILTLATVLTALYPAIPVLLALLFLRERVTDHQVVGLLLTGAASALISLG